MAELGGLEAEISKDQISTRIPEGSFVQLGDYVQRGATISARCSPALAALLLRCLAY